MVVFHAKGTLKGTLSAGGDRERAPAQWGERHNTPSPLVSGPDSLIPLSLSPHMRRLYLVRIIDTVNREGIVVVSFTLALEVP